MARYFVLSALVCGLLMGPALPASERPISGSKAAGYKPLENAITDFMDLVHAQAATVAVSKDKQLLYSRGFGWADANRTKPVPPDALMRIASVSKPVTAAAIKNAVRAKHLALDTKAFELIGITPRRGKVIDNRIYKITVAQLLEHKGGWDRDRSFDPMFANRTIEAALGLNGPAKPIDVLEYMMTQRLQFEPGERTAYSNFGYSVLGRVLEKSLNKTYIDVIQESICRPLGIKDMHLGASARRWPGEVNYPVPAELFSLELMDAHGGLVASAPALCRFLDAYWINGEPRLPGEYGNWICFGSLPGTTALARQRRDGFNIAVLLNARREEQFTKDDERLLKSVDQAIGQLGAGANTPKKSRAGE